ACGWRSTTASTTAISRPRWWAARPSPHARGRGGSRPGSGSRPTTPPPGAAPEALAGLAVLSNGRAELAVGIGYLASEASAYGFDRRDRARISDELLQIVRRLLQGDTVTFDGEIFSITDARVTPRPVQEQIPLFVGAAMQAGRRRAARYGDGYIGGVEHIP